MAAQKGGDTPVGCTENLHFGINKRNINAFPPLPKSVDLTDVFTLKEICILYAKMLGKLILTVSVDDVNVTVTGVVVARVA